MVTINTSNTAALCKNRWNLHKFLHNGFYRFLRLVLGLISFIHRMVIRICNERTVADETYDGRYGVIAGWGQTSNSTEAVPNILISASVQILDNAVCSQLWNAFNQPIHDSQLCTGLGNAATCGVRHCHACSMSSSCSSITTAISDCTDLHP